MKVLVAGGRVGFPVSWVPTVLDAMLAEGLLDPSTVEVIEGRADHTDKAAGRWADEHGFPHWKFPVNRDLDGHDDGAPKRRNIRMFDTSAPDVALIFEGGPGTRHMLTYAQSKNALIWDVEFDRAGTFRIHQWPLEKGQPSKLILEGTLHVQTVPAHAGRQRVH